MTIGMLLLTTYLMGFLTFPALVVLGVIVKGRSRNG